MWSVTACWYYTTADGWTRSGAVPTFYLHEDVQGITGPSSAERVALAILAPEGIPASVTWHVTVHRVSDAPVLS